MSAITGTSVPNCAVGVGGMGLVAVPNADKMLASYKGRERLLLEHIKKAKTRI